MFKLFIRGINYEKLIEIQSKQEQIRLHPSKETKKTQVKVKRIGKRNNLYPNK